MFLIYTDHLNLYDSFAELHLLVHKVTDTESFNNNNVFFKIMWLQNYCLAAIYTFSRYKWINLYIWIIYKRLVFLSFYNQQLLCIYGNRIALLNKLNQFNGIMKIPNWEAFSWNFNTITLTMCQKLSAIKFLWLHLLISGMRISVSEINVFPEEQIITLACAWFLFAMLISDSGKSYIS